MGRGEERRAKGGGQRGGGGEERGGRGGERRGRAIEVGERGRVEGSSLRCIALLYEIPLECDSQYCRVYLLGHCLERHIQSMPGKGDPNPNPNTML